ncbi:MAG TPA: hypothetical protein VH062_30115 [Polyangiaceae bacterium]|jgi:hypothetical protein|nr:hypothetical protein [Polyangiaceae bacterium]
MHSERRHRLGTSLAAAGLLAMAFVGCSTGNDGTLDLFPPSMTATGGAAGSQACGTAGCTAGAGGAGTGGSSVPSSGGADDNHDAAHEDEHDAGAGGARADTGAPRMDAGVPPGTCATASDCKDDSAQFCVTGSCVECEAEGDCRSGGRMHCEANTCVECRNDADCTGSKPGCLASTHRCEDCSNDAQCSMGQTCDTTQGKCR